MSSASRDMCSGESPVPSSCCAIKDAARPTPARDGAPRAGPPAAGTSGCADTATDAACNSDDTSDSKARRMRSRSSAAAGPAAEEPGERVVCGEPLEAIASATALGERRACTPGAPPRSLTSSALAASRVAAAMACCAAAFSAPSNISGCAACTARETWCISLLVSGSERTARAASCRTRLDVSSSLALATRNSASLASTAMRAAAASVLQRLASPTAASRRSCSRNRAARRSCTWRRSKRSSPADIDTIASSATADGGDTAPGAGVGADPAAGEASLARLLCVDPE
jgi:hypothetical protein